MAVSKFYDHPNRSGMMGWLYITYFSDNTTLTHWLTPTMTIHPYPYYHGHYLYQKDTPSFLSQSLIQQPCTITHTHTHIHTLAHLCWNILMVEISIVKINFTWFDSIKSEIAMPSGSARKQPKWNKVNHPRRLVWFAMRRPLLQNYQT